MKVNKVLLNSVLIGISVIFFSVNMRLLAQAAGAGPEPAEQADVAGVDGLSTDQIQSENAAADAQSDAPIAGVTNQEGDDPTEELRESIQADVVSGKEIGVYAVASVIGSLKIPQKQKTLVEGLSIKTPTIIGKSPAFEKGFGVRGSVIIKGVEVQATLNIGVVKKLSPIGEDIGLERAYTLVLEMPQKWKLGDLFDSLNTDIFNKLVFPSGKLIFSKAEYVDPSLNIRIKPGFNLVATLDLTGPLALINVLREKAKQIPKALAFDSGDVIFQGTIQQDILDSYFYARIPMRIGIDFTQIPKIPKSVSDIFKQITSDDFIIKVTPPPTNSLMLGAGIRFVLGTQKDPIALRADGTISPARLNLSFSMQNLLELKWFALGDAGIDVEIDNQLIEAAIVFGVPFTGLGIRGSLALGKPSDTRFKVSMAGAARVQSGADLKFGEMLLAGNLENLDFSVMIDHLVYNIAKGLNKEFPQGKIPVIKLNRLGIYIAPTKLTVAGKEYKAGIQVNADMQVHTFAGGLNFHLDPNPTNPVITGVGYIHPVSIKINGKEVLSITGLGPDRKAGTFDDGPSIGLLVSPERIEQSGLTMDGLLRVPEMDLSVAVKDIVISPSRIKGAVETSFKDLFKMSLGVELDPKKLEEFKILFQFKQDMVDFLEKQLPIVKESLNVHLEELNDKVWMLEGDLAKAQKKFGGKVNDEVNRVNKKIAKLKEEREGAKAKCKGPAIVQPWKKSCRKVTDLDSQIGVQEVYKNTLLKPGKKVTDIAIDATEMLVKEIAKTKALVKTTKAMLSVATKGAELLIAGTKVLEVKNVSGQYTGKDIKSGLLPKLNEFTIKLNLPEIGLKNKTITLRNVQFSFKDIGKAMRSLLIKALEKAAEALPENK